jgi:thioredoxin-like negative regulator of GroEL
MTFLSCICRCTHCKTLAPEYSSAAKILKIAGSNLTLAKVDATAEVDLAKEFGIQGFPSIFLFHRGVKSEEYNGERDADGELMWEFRSE